jgi:hypothetical protein
MGKATVTHPDFKRVRVDLIDFDKKLFLDTYRTATGQGFKGVRGQYVLPRADAAMHECEAHGRTVHYGLVCQTCKAVKRENGL